MTHFSPPQLTSSANLESLASNTQILTSIPEDLTPDNVTAAAQIVQTLLVSPNVTEVSGVTAKSTRSQSVCAGPAAGFLRFTKKCEMLKSCCFYLFVCVCVCVRVMVTLQNVRVAAVATVSQLLSANETDDAKQNNATLG